MLSKQVSNSDLMALLMGSSKSSDGGKGATDAVMGEFTKILEGQGSLEGISPEALIDLFKKNGGGAKGDAFDALMSKLEAGQGQELLKTLSFEDGKFVTPEGEVLSPDKLLEKISNENSEHLKLSNGEDYSQDLEGFRPSKEAVKKELAAKNNFSVKSAEDFLAQKRAFSGKSHVAMTENGPRLNSINAGVNRYQKESIVTDKKIIKAKHIDGMEPKIESKSDFNMTEVFEGNGENQFELSSLKMSKDSNGTDMKMSTKAQVVDLSNISANNKTELINKVSNYIEQAYVAGQDTVDMVVKHDELGQFRISATRTGVGQQIDLEISTMTEKAHQFFAENEAELVKSLTKNGVKLSDVKIVAGNDFVAMSDTRAQGGESSTGQQGRGQQQSSQSQNFGGNNQQEHGQERRRLLWQNAREQYQSYQAA